jgi:hypothetical protein
MSASSEMTDRSLFHRLLERVGHDGAMHDRESCASAIDGVVRAAVRTGVPPRNRVARPVVVLSAASALLAVAGALRDSEIDIPPSALDAVHAFMTDGAGSPLYGRDPAAARLGAEALRARIAAGEAAPRALAAAVT